MFRSLARSTRRITPNRGWTAACALAMASLACSDAHTQQPQTTKQIADEAMRTPFFDVDPIINRKVTPRRDQMESESAMDEFGHRPPRNKTIDRDTRWQFVAIEHAVSTSPIIRLGDVIRPLQPDMVAWGRLSSTTIGLMPIDGSPAKISRNRLADLIAGGAATPGRIKIFGDDTIVVQKSTNSNATPIGTQVPRMPTRQVSWQMESRGGGESQAMALGSPEAGSIDYETRQRLTQWVRLGLQTQHRELFDAFDHETVLDAREIGTLEQMQGIRDMRFIDSTPRWMADDPAPITRRIQIDGRGPGSDCQGIVQVTFTPRPAIVVARRSLQRGHRVMPGDLHLQPSPDVDVAGDRVTAIDQIVGTEVVGLVRPGVALRPSDFAAPRLIRRGDLVEVQVTGGGVRVTTTAKALGDGAKNDLIEIETITPKRRLLAKVLDSSIVEILTQPNRVATSPVSASPTKTLRPWQPQ